LTRCTERERVFAELTGLESYALVTRAPGSAYSDVTVRIFATENLAIAFYDARHVTAGWLWHAIVPVSED
jgi:hypothetical protein